MDHAIQPRCRHGVTELTSGAAHYTIADLFPKHEHSFTATYMSSFLLPSLALLLGITGLVWGADRFVAGSAALARSFGVSTLVIGLTVVSVGTSAPEILVSVNAALQGAGELAVGNALGSNLANIGLVLAVTALLAPVPVQRHLSSEEAPVLLLITALAGVCLCNGFLGRGESLLMMAIFPPLLILTVKYKRNHLTPDVLLEGAKIPELSTPAAWLWLVLGLGVLLAGAEGTVWGAKSIARQMGISELVIGLTVVAVGTSLPELAASVVSALRGQHDIAVGNVIGSNLFNILLVMSLAGSISPMHLGQQVFYRDYASMAFLTVVMVAMVIVAVRRGQTQGVQGRLSRRTGVVLLAIYALYYLLLIPGIAAS